MEATATKNSEVGSGIPGVEAKGTTPADIQVSQQNNKSVSDARPESRRRIFDCPPIGARTDCALCPAEVKHRCISPIIDAERMNDALAMVQQLRGRAA